MKQCHVSSRQKGEQMVQTPPAQKPASLYRPAGFYLLRAPAFSAQIVTQFAEDMPALEAWAGLPLHERTASFEQARQHGQERLRELIAHSTLLQAALAVASHDLTESLTHLPRHEATLPPRTQRIYSRLLRYITRMSTRPTPFGLFSGVALGTWTTQTTLKLRAPIFHHVRVRPDMGWLLALIQQLEQDPHLLPQMRVVRNALLWECGARLLLPSADAYGQQEHHSLSLRSLPLVQVIVAHTRQPVAYAQLVTRVHQAFPHVAEARIHWVLQQLWSTHVLLSTFRPPFTHVEPTTFLAEQLRTIPAAHRIHQELEALLNVVIDGSHQSMEALTQQMSGLVEHQKTLVPGYTLSPLQVDAALHVQTPAIHQQIAEAAASAAALLLRVGTHPQGSQALHQYRAAFIQKYGCAEVPLLQLLSEEGGLGAPSTYTQPPRASVLPESTTPLSEQERTRERVLSTLLAQALRTQRNEIQLNDAHLRAFTQWEPSKAHPAPALLDVFCQLHATSGEEIDQGNWLLVLTGITLGGRSMGRFVDLLGESAYAHLQTFLRVEEALFPDVLFADLQYLPTDARCGNVALHPPFHAYEIAVNTMPLRAPEQVISLDELVVGVREQRFYVRSLRLGKEIKAVQSHLLNPRFAPNVCRFLLDIAWDGCPIPECFTWGSLHHTPFLPRLTYGKIVLSLARWRLQPTDIVPQGEGDAAFRWFVGLQQWRHQWHVPRYVYLTHLDQRLLLDLEHPLLAQELATALQTCRQPGACLTLQEMLPDLTHLWLRDEQDAPFVAELVVPLLLNAPMRPPLATAEKSNPRYAWPRLIAESERRALPGGEWVYLKCATPVLFQDEVIAGPLRTLVHMLHNAGLCTTWFYLRYADPEPQLRFRFQATHAIRQEDLLHHVLAWGRQLTHEGRFSHMCLDMYEREIERYGGPALIDDVERFFTSNSEALSAVIAARTTRTLTFEPLVVAVFSLDHLCACWGLDFPARLCLAQRLAGEYEAMDAFRPYRRLLTELLVPWQTRTQEPFLKQRASLASFLTAQEAVIQPIAQHMHALDQQGDLWETPANIIRSVAHLHLNRLLGIDRTQEQQVYACWRHTLESIQKRPLAGRGGTIANKTDEQQFLS